MGIHATPARQEIHFSRHTVNTRSASPAALRIPGSVYPDAALWELADLVEIMGDSIKELAPSRRHRIFKAYRVSDETRMRVIGFDQVVSRILRKALATIAELGIDQERSMKMAYEVVTMKKEINQLADNFKQYLQEKRLQEERINEGHLSYDRIHLYAIETDLIAKLRSSANISRKIAKAVLKTYRSKILIPTS